MTSPTLVDWFVREVLPLEAALMHFLRKNWRNSEEVADLRQDVYVQIFDAARNLLIDQVRHDQVIPIGYLSGSSGIFRIVRGQFQARLSEDNRPIRAIFLRVPGNNFPGYTPATSLDCLSTQS